MAASCPQLADGVLLPRVARLENWFWTPSPPARDALNGEVFHDPPPRSWPDGAFISNSTVSELEQRGAAEGKIIVTESGRRYLLGKAATHASLAAERDAAQREADALREQVEDLQAARPALVQHLGRKKRPRGRAPAGCGWDEQRGGWFDENGKPFDVVDHPARKRLAAEAAREKFMDERKYPLVFACLFPCCGRKFAGTDAARKHARQQHGAWLQTLPAGFTERYCRLVYNSELGLPCG